MEQREPSGSAKHTEHNIISDTRTEIKNMIDYWTKDDVYQWLLKQNVPQEAADILYKEDVSGAALVCFEKRDFLDAGLKHGPAVQILKYVSLFKRSTENKRFTTPKGRDASGHFQQEKETAESPTTGSAEMETLAQISTEEHGCRKVWSFPSDDERKYKDSGNSSEETSASSGFFFSEPRPFDRSSTTYEYVQNEKLPPETGPSNCIDPVHEYKLMTNTMDASEEDVLKKFGNETFWFAAACMNCRTNGTIHFGVGDKPDYEHGQIIGLELISPNKYINEFYKGLKEHFKEKTNIAMACIRPPKFVKVKCPGNKVRWVIEIDVVPKYTLTQNNLFFTTVDKKNRNLKCFFIRSGASTMNCLPVNDLRVFKQNTRKLMYNLRLWVEFRRSSEEDIVRVSIPAAEGPISCKLQASNTGLEVGLCDI